MTRTSRSRHRRHPRTLWVDQYGRFVYAGTVRELARVAGGGRVGRMYLDMRDGKTLKIGYVVGRRWFREYSPVEEEV